jgi:hypothetical protein
MSGRRPVVKIIAESLSQHDEKHAVPIPLSVGKGRKKMKKNSGKIAKNGLMKDRHCLFCIHAPANQMYCGH